MTITAKIIADSISPSGIRLTTFELEYPRFIHAEVRTHRMFSSNAQSSRAVPVGRSLEQAIISPVTWGKNKSGMSSDESLSKDQINIVAYYWNAAARACQDFAERMAKEGLHKQWANRCLEWFSPIKVVVTATEWDNFFWLRIDPEAAQPEIVELATKMKNAMDESKPQPLQPGEWHLPYIEIGIDDQAAIQYYVNDPESEYATHTGKVEIDLETAKKISASCCAQVSYRKLDTSIEKALAIYEKLFSGSKPHLSPVEHLATPFDYSVEGFPYGATHMTKGGDYYSGNLRGWCQCRQVL